MQPDDIHFPTMNVDQTLKFALRNKAPRENPQHPKSSHNFVRDMNTGILDSLGISHTTKTRVGNEFIRGVSGGERKRVSLAEVMATQVWLSPKSPSPCASLMLRKGFDTVLGPADTGPRLQDRPRIRQNAAPRSGPQRADRRRHQVPGRQRNLRLFRHGPGPGRGPRNLLRTPGDGQVLLRRAGVRLSKGCQRR